MIWMICCMWNWGRVRKSKEIHIICNSNLQSHSMNDRERSRIKKQWYSLHLRCIIHAKKIHLEFFLVWEKNPTLQSYRDAIEETVETLKTYKDSNIKFDN